MVLRERCYDDGEDLYIWANTARPARTALPKEMKVKRYNWTEWMRGLRHTGAWYLTNLVWTDICSDKKAGEQAL